MARSGTYLANASGTKLVGPVDVATQDAAPPPTQEIPVAVTAGTEQLPTENGVAPKIVIEVAIAHLTDEQKARFGDHVEFWDTATDTFYDAPHPEGIDVANVTEALRVTFIGSCEPEASISGTPDSIGLGACCDCGDRAAGMRKASLASISCFKIALCEWPACYSPFIRF